MLTEIRLDWIPATLDFLDSFYDSHRAEIPADEAQRVLADQLSCRSVVHPQG